jgi:hypothetical protein
MLIALCIASCVCDLYSLNVTEHTWISAGFSFEVTARLTHQRVVSVKLGVQVVSKMSNTCVIKLDSAAHHAFAEINHRPLLLSTRN